jgi:uncharacterized protein
MEKIAGRKAEIALLESLKSHDASAFVAVYGRRRVGKTYLVRTVFEHDFCFQVTALAKGGTMTQIANFYGALQKFYPEIIEKRPVPDSWLSSFLLLSVCLEQDPRPRKILFLDELPWFDTSQSGFISALEHFWNSFASARRDIILITCGSAASWMVNNLINNHGGLHNRITHRIRLQPFTLAETEAFFRMKNNTLDRYHLIQIYMAMGGIPFYLEQIKKGWSAAQSIDYLCFSQDGLLRTEFDNLYPSLFKKSEKHLLVIETLSKKAKGMTRKEIIAATHLLDNGTTTKILRELEESGFIRRFKSYGNVLRDSVYQVCDFYSLFYLRFIRHSDPADKNSWLDRLDQPEVRTWGGYAFEQICLTHLGQIKKALGIANVYTLASAWQGSDGTSKAQVDLVIDRRDQTINLCEIKFSIHPFVINKAYDRILREKIGVFKAATATRKSVLLTLITSFGLANNEYAQSMVHQSLTMDALFE